MTKFDPLSPLSHFVTYLLTPTLKVCRTSRNPLLKILMINSDYLRTKPRLNPLTSDTCSLDNFNRHRPIARVKDRRRISLITVHYMKTKRTLLLTYSTEKVGFEPQRPE